MLARSNLEIGEVEEAIKLLNEVKLDYNDTQSNIAYNKIGVIMGWTLKGIIIYCYNIFKILKFIKIWINRLYC